MTFSSSYMEEKVKCSNCPETRPSEFHKNKARSNGFNNRCKACIKAFNKPHPISPEQRKIYNQNYIKAHPERAKAARRKWYKTHRDKKAAENRIQRLRQAGVTPREFDAKLQKQENRCGICGRHKTEFKRAMDADHDHETKKFRGILCGNCNRGLGMFMDSLEILEKAVTYLKTALAV
jgi:hypothetical protein